MTARLAVRVQPKARVTRVKGRLSDGTLQLAVTAPPEDGRANRALVALVGEVLQVRPSQVRLVRGASSHSKLLEIEGLSQEELERRVRALTENA